MESEKLEIQSLSLVGLLANDTRSRTIEDDSVEESGDDAETPLSADHVKVLEECLQKTHPDSLLHRQVAHILQIEQKRMSVQEEFREQQFTRAFRVKT